MENENVGILSCIGVHMYVADGFAGFVSFYTIAYVDVCQDV